METATPVDSEIVAAQSIPRENVPHLLANLGSKDPDAFVSLACKLKVEYPREVGHACISQLATRRDGKAFAHALAFILSARYLDLLIDGDVLPAEEIAQAAAVLRERDPQFFVNFTILLKTAAETDTARLIRALTLLETLKDYSVLLSVLRGLTTHDDTRVRSKAAKLLCRIRPNKPLVERQLQSSDPRVRANAIEALWFDRTLDSKSVLRASLSDKAHRVVVNALIGLYHHGDPDGFAKLLLLAQHPSEAFREAAVWAFNHLADPGALPTLEMLTEDRSETVRTKAQKAFDALRLRENSSLDIPGSNLPVKS